MQRIEIDLYRHQNPIVNDAYDRLVAAIHLKQSKGELKTCAVSGCEPGAGTTTIAINLAVSMVETGRRTILVDTDMRKEQQNKRLNHNITTGLSDYLSGDAGFEDIVCKTNFDMLDYIACGNLSENPVVLLCSSRFEELLKRIGQEYDFAIFDSSSINASVDGSILASMTAATILVVKCNSTSTNQLKSAQRELQHVGANLAGVVLNRMEKDEYSRYLKSYNHYFRKK